MQPEHYEDNMLGMRKSQDAAAKTTTGPKHINLNDAILELGNLAHSADDLLSKIVGEDTAKEVATPAPHPDPTLNQVLTTGPDVIRDYNKTISGLLQQIHAALY